MKAELERMCNCGVKITIESKDEIKKDGNDRYIECPYCGRKTNINMSIKMKT